MYWKLIDPQIYTPIKQGMVIIKATKNAAEAEKFYQYILSADAKKILKAYGYGV